MRTVADLERLSALIDFIYRGATEPALWPDIVARASDWLNAPMGMLYTPLHGAEQGGFYFHHGLADHFLDLYKARYQAVDLWTEQVVARDLFREGNVILGTDLVPTATLAASAWYRDCLQVGGISQLLSSAVFGLQPAGADHRTADMPTACSFYRGVGDAEFGEADRRQLALLLPHISRSLGVMTRLRLADFQVAASLSAIDRLPTAVLLMSYRGDVLFANRAAGALLDGAGALSLDRSATACGLGKLVAASDSVEREIARALSAARRIDDVVHFSSVIRIAGRLPGSEWLLQLSRVQLGTAFRTEGRVPEVIAFLTDPRRPVQADADLLRRTYGLTAAESQVAAAASSIGSVEELAAALSLRANTVKTHLKQIYAKTGVASRAELVRVLLGLARAG